MELFTTCTAVALPIDIANCDTDQIIPARFLRRPHDDPDYGNFLFHDLRFNEDGSPKDFVFDRAAYRGAGILVADLNWGCGSSRENAVWALQANNIRCVIAPSMGDIHHNNCIKRGVLPVILPADACADLRRHLHANPGATITVDLEAQTVTGPGNAAYSFAIEPSNKHRLLNGLDDIGITLERASRIEAFEDKRRQQAGWLT